MLIAEQTEKHRSDASRTAAWIIAMGDDYAPHPVGRIPASVRSFGLEAFRDLRSRARQGATLSEDAQAFASARAEWHREATRTILRNEGNLLAILRSCAALKREASRRPSPELSGLAQELWRMAQAFGVRGPLPEDDDQLEQIAIDRAWALCEDRAWL